MRPLKVLEAFEFHRLGLLSVPPGLALLSLPARVASAPLQQSPTRWMRCKSNHV